MIEESKVYYTDAAIEGIGQDKTLPMKFKRILDKYPLAEMVAKKSVAIKMHFGTGYGFSTIHPLFIKVLVDELKKAGARSIKILDMGIQNAIPRGYTNEVIGCSVVSTFGESNKYYYKEPIGFKTVDEVLFGGEAVDCDFFIDLSHVKGHGDCGFGAAIKNIAMGVIHPISRGKLHQVEGGIDYDKSKCDYCLKCKKACQREVIIANNKEKKIGFFYHHCTYCQHCVLVCPNKAITMNERDFENFSRAMAIVTGRFLKKFEPKNLLFINFLLNITMLCDCWGITSPSLVPDIGILVSDNIYAIEKQTLDMIKTEDLLPKSLIKPFTLQEKGSHLFEKIHGKDPYLMVNFLPEYYDCNKNYEVLEVH